MARARNIKPALFKNELLGVADPLLTLLFQSLWTLADKEGRLEDRPLRIKAETFPYRDSIDVNGYLTELQRLGFITRYLVGSLALIQVVNFKKHQTPHNTEKPSELPPPSAGTIVNIEVIDTSVKTPLSNGENIDALPPDLLIPSSLIPDSPSPISDVNQTAKACAAFALPDWIDQEAWDLWLKTRKKKMIPEQMQAQVKKLGVWRAAGLDYAKALADAADAGWQGLVEPVQLANASRKSGTSYHEKLSDTAEQIFGRKHGTGNQIIDITPKQATGSDPENIPAVYAGLRA